MVTSVIQQDGTWLPPVLSFRTSLYDNQDGKGNFARAGEPIEGNFVLAADINADGLGDLVETPTELSGIVVHENLTKIFVAEDFNRDGEVNDADVDRLCQAIADGENDSMFDLNGDARVDLADHSYLVDGKFDVVFGDVNRDGVFDSSDLIRVLKVGEYEDSAVANSSWGDGDWNCDREFTSSDLVVAFKQGSISTLSATASMLIVGHDILLYNEFGMRSGVFASVDNPVGIAVSSNGDVFVSNRSRSGFSGISRYDQNGQLLATVSSINAGPLTLGPDERTLYSASYLGDRVEYFSVANGSVASLGVLSGGVDGPAGIAMGPDGLLYVSGTLSRNVVRYDVATGALVDIFISSHLRKPQGIAFGPDGHLYVADAHESQGILRFDGTSGAFVEVFAKPTLFRTSDMTPVFGPDGSLFVGGSSLRDGIERFDGGTGEYIDEFITEARGALNLAGQFAFLPPR